jgi:hypothetical protein
MQPDCPPGAASSDQEALSSNRFTLAPQHEEHSPVPGIDCDSGNFGAREKNEHLSQFSFC